VPSILESLPPGSRVAILRLRSLGDCVLTTPALGILKRRRPDLRIAVVVENAFREIFERNPDIDDLLAPGLLPLRRFAPKLCLNLHGGTRSAWMTALSGAQYRAGFGHFRHSWVYNVAIPRAQEIFGIERKVHTAEHLASAVFFLGAPIAEIPRAKVFANSVKSAPAASCAVIHPVAARPDKTWPADRFLAVAGHLHQNGIEPVFIGGPSDDLSPFNPYRTIQGAPLSQIKGLLSSASLFLGNDSGPAHMAAAFGLPAVVIFGSSDPAIWGPWRTAGEALTSPGGIAEIPVSRVLEAIERARVHA
jgi:ADP-heptose:LPS heptosyltransferase